MVLSHRPFYVSGSVYLKLVYVLLPVEQFLSLIAYVRLNAVAQSRVDRFVHSTHHPRLMVNICLIGVFQGYQTLQQTLVMILEWRQVFVDTYQPPLAVSNGCVHFGAQAGHDTFGFLVA